MKTIIVLFIYLSGCFTCYLDGRSDFTKTTGRYTFTDRSVMVLISSLSWIGVAAVEFVKLIEGATGNEPANW